MDGGRDLEKRSCCKFGSALTFPLVSPPMTWRASKDLNTLDQRHMGKLTFPGFYRFQPYLATRDNLQDT